MRVDFFLNQTGWLVHKNKTSETSDLKPASKKSKRQKNNSSSEVIFTQEICAV